MSIKVKLREKPISGNRKSLYLDFYPAIINNEGKPTRREFLGKYIHSPIKTVIKKNGEKVETFHFDKITNEIYSLHNVETNQVAKKILQERQNQLDKPEIYNPFEREQLKVIEKGKADFVEYFEKLANKKKTSNFDNWISAYKYLHAFTQGSLRFADLNESFCNDFKDYLLTTKSNKSDKATLSNNSALSYFNKFKASLKQAYKDGFLQTDLNAKIDTIKQADTRRNYLTLEELNSLVGTECKNPQYKQAALFSALTGLRFSDIQNIVWGQIEHIEGQGYFIHFKQQKTKGVEEMPISKQAYTLCGEPKEPTQKVFEGLKYSAYENRTLAQWVKDAGIIKAITFHCFRHTFATLQLSMGTDIYTVSKLLGHRDLKTTQVYAKVISKTKRDAADKMQLKTLEIL